MPRTHPNPAPPDLSAAELAAEPPELGDIVERLQTATIARGRRLIVILRVSKTGGREKLAEGFIAEPEQLGKCEGYANAHGCEIVDVRRERNVSGGSVDRDVLNDAVADVLAGKADGIIVARVNRYARTTAGLQMVRKLQAAGKTFVAVDEGIGPEMLQTSFGWFTFTIMLAVAELQLAMLTEGFRTAREMHVAAGIAAQVPYGYRKRSASEEDRPRRLERNPETAAFVPFMFKRRAAGDSWPAIALALDAAGAPTPSGTATWKHERVRTIVQNRAYLGELTSGEFVNRKAHPALVSPEEFNDANALNQPSNRNGKANYPLTGVLRCASCGGRMVGFMQTIKSGKKRTGPPVKYRYYKCRVRYGWGRCESPAYAKADEIEALVIGEFFRRFTGELDAALCEEDRSAELAEAEAEVTAAEAALDLFVDSPATARTALRRGQAWYDQRVDALTDELTTAQAAAQEVRNAVAGFDLPPGIEQDWDGLTLEVQRGFLGRAFGVVAVGSAARRSIPVADRIRIWARDEAGSPEADLAARDDDGHMVKVPIKL
jgi:DNA invertase Pin-like site-specific DNA recombinase